MACARTEHGGLTPEQRQVLTTPAGRAADRAGNARLSQDEREQQYGIARRNFERALSQVGIKEKTAHNCSM